jgi:hypothetical protein
MNVQEVISISRERRVRLKDIIEKLLSNIHKKIKYYARHRQESCTYIIPPLMDDFIIYDRKGVTKDIFKRLDNEGYIVTAYENGQFDICWNEKLVEKKINNDKFILSQEEKRLNRYNKDAKTVYDRFAFLSNPNKTLAEPTLEEKIDRELEKILREKDREQNRLSKRIGNFNKL